MMKKLSRLILFIIMILFVWQAFESANNFRQKQTKILGEADKIKVLEKENARLKTRLKEVASPRFIEEEARNRLNMCRPGETVVVGK